MRPLDPKLIDPPAGSTEAAEGEPTAGQSRAKPGVLVVDDDHLVRIMVQLGLEYHGLNVWLASDGHEAIEVYRHYQDSIDVVLLDVRMPGLDGPQTLDILRELNSQVLVCFMSGEMGDYEPEQLRQRGAAHVITKPFYLSELATTLRLLAHSVPSADPLLSGEGCQG
jgi:CheY-like chemotaxis protein